MSVKLLTEHRLEFLSIEEGCRDSSESTLVKMPHCWKSHVTAQVKPKQFCAGSIFCTFYVIFFYQKGTITYSKTYVKRLLKNKQSKGLNDK